MTVRQARKKYNRTSHYDRWGEKQLGTMWLINHQQRKVQHSPLSEPNRANKIKTSSSEWQSDRWGAIFIRYYVWEIDYRLSKTAMVEATGRFEIFEGPQILTNKMRK